MTTHNCFFLLLFLCLFEHYSYLIAEKIYVWMWFYEIQIAKSDQLLERVGGGAGKYGRHGNIMHLGNVTEDVLEKYQLINYS